MTMVHVQLSMASLMSSTIIPSIMKLSNKKIAGTLLFIAAAQFVFALIAAEALFPGYSTSANYISDLGVGPSAILFNSSVFLMGLFMIISAYFLQRAIDYTLLTVLLVLTSIGVMGVGVFTEDSITIHVIVSVMAFLFGGLSAIFSAICSYVHEYRLLKTPFAIITVILGVISLGALTLLAINIDLGLGVGGIERMIAYPLLMWSAGLGAYLMAAPDRGTAK